MSGTLAITMAGFGSRFLNAGYDIPKYQIVACGLPLFDWSMRSLDAFREAGWCYAFAVRGADNSQPFIQERCDGLSIPVADFLSLDAPTDGQATTALLLAERSDANLPFAIFNIDTLVRPGAMSPEATPKDAIGWIPCFPGPGEGWSFARTDETGRVVELREKSRISEHATVGFYWFRTASLYIDMYKKYFSAGGEEKGERYVAPLYNQLIADGMDVRIASLAIDDIGMLGTPEQVAAFEKAPPYFIEQMG